MDEKWKTINKYSMYAISNWGRVKRIVGGTGTEKNKILKPFSTGKNRKYLCVYLYSHNKKRVCAKIHQLVAEMFVGPRPKNKQVNHIDGNTENNYDWNLEYVTNKKNIRHAHRLGLFNNIKGEKHSNCKLTDKEVVKIRKLYKTEKYKHRELASMFNISVGYVWHLVNFSWRKKVKQ